MRYLIYTFAFLSFCIKCYAQGNPCDRSISAKLTPTDTTIKLPSGSMITMNRCEYFDIRNCLIFEDMGDTSYLRRNNINVRDQNNAALVSLGMINVSLMQCANTCVEIPIIIRIPATNNTCNGVSEQPGMYTLVNNRWKRDDRRTYWFDTINNVPYICYKMQCGGMGKNSDIPVPDRKIKIKLSRRKRFTQYRVASVCPVYYYNAEQIAPKRKIKPKIVCSKEENIRIEAIIFDKSNGNFIDTSFVLSYVKHTKRKLKCDKRKIKLLGKNVFTFYSRKGAKIHKKFKLYF